MRLGYSHLRGPFRSPAMQTQRRSPTRQVDHLNLAPRHTLRNPCTQRLRAGLLRCKACGKTLRSIVLLAPAVCNLRRCINTLQKPLSISLNRLSNPQNLN